MAETPLMRQYLGIKEQYPDCVLFFRMGDFYELFGDDAVLASRILGITLTKRNNGKDGEKELCGFPHHAAERYVPKMVQAGYKVAICEQIEDPKEAKGIVKRDVIEVITAGTTLSDSNLDAKKNNYLACTCPSPYKEGDFALAGLDLSTGEFFATSGPMESILSEVHRMHASEILMPAGDQFAESSFGQELLELDSLRKTPLPNIEWEAQRNFESLCAQFKVSTLEGLGFDKSESALLPAGAVLRYAKDLKKDPLNHIRPLVKHSLNDYMILDPHTQRNLELVEPLNREDQKATLLSVLDFTQTALGARMLRAWITQPLLDIAKINTRLEAIDELRADLALRDDLKSQLREIHDLERLMTRVVTGRINPKELLALSKSIRGAQRAASLLNEAESPLLKSLWNQAQGLGNKPERIENTLNDDPPLTVREGKMIRPGASEKLDALNEGIREAREWLANLESSQRASTGISSLKVGYNKVFGYFIEVSNTHKDKVPASYIRKQTLANAERFITPEMKDYESLILNAEGEINQVEFELYTELRNEVQTWLGEILQLAEAIAQVDTLLSMAIASEKFQWCKPVLYKDQRLQIKEGFHPVVVKNNPDQTFIRNGVKLGEEAARLALITGPNMAGKSTYLRQTGLIVLMAQMGSYVPAQSAEIGLVDRIFTRVGASDRLSRGQSTFMVEMVETAHILNSATPDSLILLDEIGRGTSTFDGLSLAWALVEELHDNPLRNGKTLFATHYHELTALADQLPQAANFHVTVKDNDGHLVFLRKVVEGASDSSYGIQVAQMAGIPQSVIARASEVLFDLEKGKTEHGPSMDSAGSVEMAANASPSYNEQGQVDMFGVVKINKNHEKLYRQLDKLDVNELTPLQAITILSKWKEKFFE